MAVPDARVELQIAGVWTATGDDLLHGDGIRYSWGRRAEGSRTDPAAASFSLRNPDGKYSGRNPSSPYFGQLGRNTPVRLSHDGADVALVIPSGIAGRAATPDVAALDITGDIDVRADLTPSAWGGETTNGSWEVMGKYLVTGNQRSWLLVVRDAGVVEFRWSTDGTAIVQVLSTVRVPFEPGQRGAIRATLDVNNGSGGYTVTFYTAATMGGSWTQLGSSIVTTAGTTSIYNSTTALTVGDIQALAFANLSRQFHAIEVRNGIGGSAVANPVFTSQTSGATSFVDAAGRTWTAADGAEITSRRIRAVLEASSWTPRWGASGHDVTTPVDAAGILRRLGQGDKALASTLRRRLPTQGPAAYWPMEDGRDAVQAYSPIVGCAPLPVQGFQFAQDDTCPGSSALPSIDAAATMQGPVPAYDPASTGYLVSFIYSIAAPPASDQPLLAFTTTGTARGIVLYLTSAGFDVKGFSAAGATVFSQGYSASVTGDGRWYRVDIAAQNNGGNVDFHVGFVEIDGEGGSGDFSFAGSSGAVVSIDTAFGALLSGMKVGHLAVFPTSNLAVWGNSDNGYGGEAVGDRIIRLGAEEAVPVTVAQSDGTATQLGAQRPNTLLDLLAQCEAADDGILCEDRERPGLSYRTRNTLYSQTPKLTVAYGQLAPPLEPTDDDRGIRNDRTVTRIGGSSARAVLTTGALSVAAPPAGVGIYDDTQTVNVHSDAQVEDLADWLLHRGTWDESRYPKVRFYLHKTPELIPAVSALRPGDLIRITDLPPWLPPGPVDLMVEGGDEEFKTFIWTVTLACSPGGPWQVAVLDDASLARLGAGASTLASGITNTATSLSVATASGPLWSTSAGEYPQTIEIGGEDMTLTAVSGSSSPQTFTVTRSANGIVKSHLASAPVAPAQPMILAL